MTSVLSETTRTTALGSIPMGRIGAPEDVARAVAFLAIDAGFRGMCSCPVAVCAGGAIFPSSTSCPACCWWRL